MICVLLLPVWVGWTVETPPEAEGKRKTSFGKYKTNEQDVHNTILACAIITWRLLFWKIQLHFFNGTIMFTSGFSSFLILHYYTYYPNTPLQKTIETCLLHRLCGDLHSAHMVVLLAYSGPDVVVNSWKGHTLKTNLLHSCFMLQIFAVGYSWDIFC